MSSQNALGLLMILAGLALASGGVAVLVRGQVPAPAILDDGPGNPPPSEEQARSFQEANAPRAASPPIGLTPEEKGRKFEEWVVRKFNPAYFTIKDWRGDKHVAGISSESSQFPDLEVEFHLRDRRAGFAVECKWRRSFTAGPKAGIEWATPRQIETYGRFQRDRGLPVFAAIGVGGEPDRPSEVYVVPLDRLKYPFATIEHLAKFRRASPSLNFFFDPEKTELR